jgi:lipoate-protein ligase A
MRCLDLSLTTPAENLACDEALLDAAEAGEPVAQLRFWESAVPFVVVGYANQRAREVNVAVCAAQGVPILRRCSGGGTVVQGPGCLNYALVLPIDPAGPTRTIAAANQFIMERNRQAISTALREAGRREPTPVVEGHTDLAVGGLKFSGNAQRRRKHFLLFHGTFLLAFDLNRVSELLRSPSQAPAYRAGRAHAEFITNLQLSAAGVKAALRRVWAVDGETSQYPEAATRLLVATRYSQAEWNDKF